MKFKLSLRNDKPAAREAVTIQYFDEWKELRQKAVTPAKYTELLQQARALPPDTSVSFNAYLAELP